MSISLKAENYHILCETGKRKIIYIYFSVIR